MNILGVGSALLAVALCAASAADEVPAIAIDGAWVRALPPTRSNTAAYMVIENSGGAAVTIVGASSDLAERVEIHTTREVDGLQRMVQLEQLELAPGQRLELAPGGTHLMLLGLEQMPVAGQQVPLCLQPAAGEEVCVSAEVRADGGPSSHEHHHH